MKPVHKSSVSSQGASGHYGIVKCDGVYIGGFLKWNIGIDKQKGWKATSKKYWMQSDIKEGCEAFFYQMINDKEVLLAHEKVRLEYGVNTKDQLIKALIEMYKE